jgi:molybdopterin-guanine dinucleotide biosynthesis protein A
MAQGSYSPLLERYAFSDHDLLLVEGLKELPIQKLLLADAERRILDFLRDGSVTNVAALVVPDDPASYTVFCMPVLSLDSVGDIAVFIESILIERSLTEIFPYGLVLAGGQSLRMGSDKALMQYHTENQLLRTAALLQPYCREEQAETYRPYGIPLITDTYLGSGPSGGLLSAQQIRPEAAWVVAACDLPFHKDALSGTFAHSAIHFDSLRLSGILNPGFLNRFMPAMSQNHV